MKYAVKDNNNISYRRAVEMRRRARKTRICVNFMKILAIVVIFIAAVSAVLIMSCNAVKTNAAVNSGTKYYKSVIIEPGDTLWSIAERYMDDSEYYDTRDYIKELRTINNLATDNIKCGNHLIVPYIIYE